ncbi:hypothetical protein AB0M87_23755 [Streptomyces sp. NPDC051320]|uniref:hypothetical protein n=1 Tax=Streptomyces sp. NPDC051320 TaxID=3154644 RepID=UPI00342D513A
MIEQATKRTAECSNCGGACEGWVIQISEKGRLRWEIEWSCDVCGISHDGGWGPAPEHIRQALISDHGISCIRISAATAHRGKVLKAFREALGVPIQEANALAKELAATGWQGTQVETSLIAELLQASDIAVQECDRGLGDQ